MTLGLSPLVRAIARLREWLVRFHADESDTLVRDGLIQRFEFAYDLAHKMLRRALADTADTPEEIDRMTFPALIHAGVGQGVLPGQETDWQTFRELRALSPHSYDDAKALAVVVALPTFLAMAAELLARLQGHGYSLAG